jgi:hypothetical protein
LPSTGGVVTGASTFNSNLSVGGNLIVSGSVTLGDSGSDALVINAAPSIGGAGLGMGMGFRNRIINGAMVIDQRNAGAAVTASASFPIDRFSVVSVNDGAFSAQQDSSAPNGFVNSTKITTTTADGSLTTNQRLFLRQRIEGTNVSDFGWGTANAQTVTLSFWVRSSLTGTFGGALQNSAANRSYPFTYSISSANTWEYKSVIIAGDTSGTWLTTTGIGVQVIFGLGVGPDLSGTSGSWAGAEYASATGAVSVIGTLNATWYITGVQLEKGSTATSFDYRPYGTELALCQRYYYRLNTANEQGNYTIFGWGHAYGTGIINVTINLPVSMRTYPTTLDTSAMSTFQYETGTTSGTTPTSIAINNNSNSFWMASIDVNKSASFTNAASYKLQAANNKTAYLGFGAEL